jgi:Lrp/AsnC family leucine-responsive transcriptional regulator
MSDKIDETDRLILEELRKDSRQSTSDISRKTDIKRMTVHERIKRLKENGVIKRFTIVPDYAKIGLPVSAYVLISYNQHEGVPEMQLVQKIAKLPNVYEVNIVLGEYDLLVKVRGASLESIGELVVQHIGLMKGVSKTFTMACHHSVSDIAR